MLENETTTDEQSTATTTQTEERGTSIAKFATAEERDRAYLELERRVTQEAQEKAELKRQLEDRESQVYRQTAPAATGEFTDVYKSQKELQEFWKRFAEKPQEVFGEWATQTLTAFEQRQAMRDAARDALHEFKTKNPDLAEYEEIVSTFVMKQPANLSPKEKLTRVVPEVRKLINQIAGKHKDTGVATFDNNTFVEAPAGTRDGGSRTVAKQPEEDSLAEYLKEQAAIAAKKATPPRSK